MFKKLTKIGLMVLSLIMCVSAFAACAGEKFDENKAIVVVSREEGSGSRNAFMELVYGKGFEEIVLPTTHVSHTSYSAVANKVKTDPQSIAYDSYGFVTDDVKMLTINGVACTITNISNATYKLMRPFSVAYREENIDATNAANAANIKFLEYLQSSNAQAILSGDGFIGDSTRTTPYAPEVGLSGTIKVSGGSTVALLVEKYAEEFKSLQPGVTVVVSSSNSGGGRTDVQTGESHFGMVGAKVTEEHMEFMESSGHKVLVTKLCDDGIAVIVNKKNPITNITTEQLKNIYNKDSATKYSNWSELMAAQEAA